MHRGGKNDPLGVVQKGIEIYENNRSIDIVICLIDKDMHSNFTQALQKAKNFQKLLQKSRKKKIKETVFRAIPSYPCFEIWLLFHFIYTTAPFYGSGQRNTSCCEQVIKKLKKKGRLTDYKKGGTGVYEQTKHLLKEARINSLKVKRNALAINRLNPSTDMHDVFSLIEAASGK